MGLTTGACLAETGKEVLCVDIDEEKIKTLGKKTCPLYEPGLPDLVASNIEGGRLSFTSDVKLAIEDSEIIICCVGTPADENYNANTEQVLTAAKNTGKYLNRRAVFIIKSTVPLGTAEKCKATIQDEVGKRRADYQCDVVSNPEFLSQGTALEDTVCPDRIVFGIDNPEVKTILNDLYGSFIKNDAPFVYTNFKTAETIKYAANAFLCTKVSFINEIAQFCDKAGVNVKDVAYGMGLDKRIAAGYLNAGIGYGGNCLKKDINALINMGYAYEHQFPILQAVETVNENQKYILLQKLEMHLEGLDQKKIAVWGLSFKPKTDDLRDAPSIEIVQELVDHGAEVRVYDPVSTQRFVADYFRDNSNVLPAKTKVDAAKNADAIVILTGWDEFLDVDFNNLKTAMKGNLILDGRNIYDPKQVKRAGIKYVGIGV